MQPCIFTKMPLCTLKNPKLKILKKYAMMNKEFEQGPVGHIGKCCLPHNLILKLIQRY